MYIYMYNKIYCTVYIYIHIDPLPICLVYFATCLRTTMRFWAIHQGVEYLVYAESRLPSQSHSMVFVFLGESSICWAILGKHIECQCAKCSMLLLQGELVFLNFLTVYNWPHKSSANHNVGKFPVCQNGWQRKVFFFWLFSCRILPQDSWNWKLRGVVGSLSHHIGNKATPDVRICCHRPAKTALGGNLWQLWSCSWLVFRMALGCFCVWYSVSVFMLDEWWIIYIYIFCS